MSSPGDTEVLQQIQGRFEVKVTELPDSIDPSTYSMWLYLNPVISYSHKACRSDILNPYPVHNLMSHNDDRVLVMYTPWSIHRNS